MTDTEKDAARYRWLRDRLQVRYMEALGTGEKRQGLVMRIGHGFLDSKLRPEYGWTDPRYFDECRQKVDAAIDAAAESYNAVAEPRGASASGNLLCSRWTRATDDPAKPL